MNAVSRTEPNSATRPTSFRPRSTSIRCSARSLGSAASSSASAASCSGSRPRGRVPGDRPDGHLALLHPHQDLGRAADDVDVVAVQIVEIRRGVERTQIAIAQERVRCRQVDPAAQHRLESVARGDVLLDPAHVDPGTARRGTASARAGSGGRRLDRQRLDRAGAASRCSQRSIRASACRIQPAELVGRPRPRRHLHAGDDRGAVEEVVQHEQRVGHHHDRRRAGRGRRAVHRAATRSSARRRSPRTRRRRR